MRNSVSRKKKVSISLFLEPKQPYYCHLSAETFKLPSGNFLLMLPLSMPSEMSTLALLKRLLTTRKRHIRDIYANMARMVYHRTSQAKKGPDALQFSGEIPFKQERICLTDFEAFEEHKQCSVQVALLLV